MELKLKPWAKATIAFLIGVIAVAQVFKIDNSNASTGENIVVHGVIELNMNGKSHVKPIDGAWGRDIVLDVKEHYNPMQIVTVVIDGGEIVDDYVTEGRELDKVIDINSALINEYQDSIRKNVYE